MNTTTTNEQQQQYGATYSTDPDTFGEITHVFPVQPGWDGYRFHGYCRPTADEIHAAGYIA